MKRVVIFSWKDDREPMQVFRSAADLVRQHGKEIGICLEALWNALSKGKGVYENKKCRVEYKDINAR